jgi:hypothetical protein
MLRSRVFSLGGTTPIRRVGLALSIPSAPGILVGRCQISLRILARPYPHARPAQGARNRNPPQVSAPQPSADRRSKGQGRKNITPVLSDRQLLDLLIATFSSVTISNGPPESSDVCAEPPRLKHTSFDPSDPSSNHQWPCQTVDNGGRNSPDL